MELSASLSTVLPVVTAAGFDSGLVTQAVQYLHSEWKIILNPSLRFTFYLSLRDLDEDPNNL